MEALLQRSGVSNESNSHGHDPEGQAIATTMFDARNQTAQITRVPIPRVHRQHNSILEEQEIVSSTPAIDSLESSSRRNLTTPNAEQDHPNVLHASSDSSRTLLRDTGNALGDNKFSVNHSSFKIQKFSSLMSDEAMPEFLTAKLDEINAIYPIFDATTLGAALTQPASDENVERWVYLNALLGLGYLHRADNIQHVENLKSAWALFKNCFASFPQLLVQGRSLLGIDAILCMALFLGRSTDKRSTYLLVASALNLYSMLSVSTGSLNPGFDAVSLNRSFWIAYIMDKEMSLSCGLLPSFNDDEVRPNIPEALSTQQKELSIFSQRCNLAVIHSTIYQRLYKRANKNQSPAELFGIINMMEIGLNIWKDTLTAGVRRFVDDTLTEIVPPFHLFSLFLSYYNALNMALRPAKRSNSWISFSKRHNAAVRSTLRWVQNIQLYPVTDIW